MDMADNESPERSHSGVLRIKSRHKKGVVDSSNVSLASTETNGGLRGSIDRGMDRLKVHTSNDGGERRPSMDVGKRLSKFIHRKHKHKKTKEDSDAQRGRSNIPKSEGLLDPDTSSRTSIEGDAQSWTRSRSGSRDSSLLTNDSDVGEGFKPSLVSRPSHAAYLTLSSPLIDAETESSITPPHTASATSLEADATLEAPPVSYIFQDVNKGTPEHLIARKELGSLAKASPVLPPRPRPDDHAVNFAEPSYSGTPSTVITPATPTEPQPPSPKKSPLSLGTLRLGNNTSPRTVQLSGTRRARASTGSGSGKYGNFSSILASTTEEAKTPGGSLTSPLGTSGFFSSVFSATQNAVNQITNSINSSTPNHQRSRSGTLISENDRFGTKEPDPVVSEIDDFDSHDTIRPEPAVATLGLGNLSLSHLGLPEDPDPALMLSRVESNKSNNETSRSRARSIAQSVAAASKGEEISAAEAVSAAYSDKPIPVVTEDAAVSSRPRSIASAVGSAKGEVTPPRVSPNEPDGGGIQRSGSVRSRISIKGKRHRGSSTATGNTIAAALSASHNPTTPPEPRPSLVGSKRNKDFHNLFRSVPEDDTLVEDHSAALQRDILLQGRLYISEKHICFASNILGWVTNVVMNYDEVVSMEKRMTAKIFPNAIHIQTLHAKHFFASLLSRDATYDLLIAQWKIGHPVRLSATGHELDESGTAQKADTIASLDNSDLGSNDYSDSEDDSHGSSSSNAGTEYVEAGEVIETTKVQRKVSVNGGSPAAGAGTGAGAISTMGEFPGPVTHAPTDCDDHNTHLEKQVMDTTIPAPLGKIYSMLFGPQSGQVMRNFLVNDQKSGDLQMEDDKRGLGEDAKTFSYSFVKPLYGAIGPKQTRCLVTYNLDQFDLEKAVSVTASTQTPDVPSGGVFVTKTKYCLTWGPANSTRFVMSTAVEWSGKSWLKSPIEKGANDGQILYGKDVTNFLKANVANGGGGGGGGGAVKTALVRRRSKTKERKKRSGTDATDIEVTKRTTSKHSSSKDADWGILEPLRAIVDILGSLVSPVTVLGVLLLVFAVLWVRSAYFARPPDRYAVGAGRSQRAYVYDDLWRREDSDLWTWLEDRMALEDVTSAVANVASRGRGDGGEGEHAATQHRLQLQSREMEGRLEAHDADEKKITEAIRVTQEHLEALKLAKDRRAAQAAAGAKRKGK